MVAVEPGAVLATMAIRWMRDLAEVDLFVVRFATERTATQWAWHGSSNAVRTEYLPAASNLRGAAADNLGMSLPRAIVPGRRYMITRRCSERRFFMRPDRETNNAFIYCLALAARKAGVSIVCLGTLSNHYHAVVVDNHGRLRFPGSYRLFAAHKVGSRRNSIRAVNAGPMLGIHRRRELFP